MSPFLMLRVWLRRAPVANRVTAGAALLAVMALVVWMAVPGAAPSAQVTAAGVAAGGGAQATVGSSRAAGSPGPVAGPAAAGTGTAGGGGAQSPAGGAAAATVGGGSSPAGGAPVAGGAPRGGSGGPSGCSSTSPLKVGAILPDVGSGSNSANSALNIPSPAQMEAEYNAMFDSVNKAGGVACHTLVADFYAFDAVDPTDAQRACLQMVQDKVYAVLGGLEPASPDTCLLQNHLPTIDQIMVSGLDVKKFYPYYFTPNGIFEQVMRNLAGAIDRLGYLSKAKGFKKLGVLLRDCIPDEYSTLTGALAAHGVGSSQISLFDFGCPGTLQDAPSSVEEAVLQFERDGVTDVTPVDASGDLQPFTRDARAQGFHPQYLVPDDGSFATINSPQDAPDPTNFDGAVGISGLQYGGIEAHLPEDPATKRCDAVMTSHGLPDVFHTPVQFSGSVCDLTWMLVAAMGNDPGLSPTGLAAGLAKAGPVPMAYPDGPNNFGPGVTWGGVDWRENVYSASCQCFKTVQPTFQQPF